MRSWFLEEGYGKKLRKNQRTKWPYRKRNLQKENEKNQKQKENFKKWNLWAKLTMLLKLWAKNF